MTLGARDMSNGDQVVWDSRRRRHVVQVELTPGEAENVAQALGPGDAAADHLRALAGQARARDERHESGPRVPPAGDREGDDR